MAVALAFKLASTWKYTSSQEVRLGGRGCAPGAMQRKRIPRRCVLRQRRIPSNDLRGAGEIKPGSCQRRHVQRLTDMAGSIGPICMLVEQGAAGRKKEQRGASKHRQRATRHSSSENGYPQVHKRQFSLAL